MDLAAKAAGRDTIEFRLAHLADESDPDQRRKAAVLRLAAEKAGWGDVPAGRALGVAVHKSFGSYAAQVVEVSGDPEQGIKIEKVTCAVDCGIAVNPMLYALRWKVGSGMALVT